MDTSADSLARELEALRRDQHELKEELVRVKRILFVLSRFLINECKNDHNFHSFANQLLVLDASHTTTDFDQFNSREIVAKIVDQVNRGDHIDESDDQMVENQQVVKETKRRGRPPKNTSYLVTKKSKILSKSSTNPKKKLSQRASLRRESILAKNKGKVVTDEGKEVFLSRTKRLRCQWPGCDAMFRDREDLENHNWRHTGEKAYTCDWPGCSKSFSSRCYLKKHHKTHVDPNVFKCLHEGCPDAFVTSTELNGHFDDRHEGNKPFPCVWPGCSQQFAVKRNLKDHQIVHIDEKRFRCDWPGCDGAFKRKQQLDIHVCEVHRAEGKLRCDWPGCESTFSSHNKLKIHKMRHTGEKPFKCQWPSCEWSFRQHNHLKTHMLKHSGEKPFQCESPGCDRRFQTKQTMKFHYEKCHRLV